MESLKAIAAGLCLIGILLMGKVWMQALVDRENLEDCSPMQGKSLEELEVDIGRRLGDGRPVRMTVRGCPPNAAKVEDWNPRR